LQRQTAIGVRTPIRKVVEADNKSLPSILDDDEIRRLLGKLPNPHRLIASFAFGSGLLLSESRSLRLRDLDYDNLRILVRKSRGMVERETILPKYMVSDLKKWLEEKYRGLPLNEDCYLFPSRSLKSDDKQCLPKSPISPKAVQAAMWIAAEDAGLNKTATCMILRHCFAVSLLESGVNIRTVQKLLGHRRVENTAIYLRVLRTAPTPPVSPLDVLFGQEV
jgi:site-specific recombinase XerD